MRKRAALLLVLWLAMSMGSWGQDKLKGGLGLKGGGAASKPTERAKKVALVQKFMDGALNSLAKHQTAKAEELMKGAMEYLYNDNTIKDKAPKLEEFMKEAIKFLEQDMIEKSEEMIKGATVYLESDDEAKDEKSGKRVKYLENDKVAAGVNKVRLVDDFLKEALQYLDAEQEVKAKEIIQGIRLYVSQCDEIEDKAASVEEMIQAALTFIEQDNLDEAEDVIYGAMTYLDNDDDVKQLSKAGHAQGVKYLEQVKAERGIEKAIFVDEVLKGALSYIDKKQVLQAKEIVQATVMYVAQDDTMKDKAATSMEMMDGALTFLQQDQMNKAKEMIQGAMAYLEGDEDVKEADKLLRGMDVKEQDKLVKDVKDKAKAKTKRVKYLENNKVAAGVNKGRLVDDFLEEALTYLDSDQAAKAKDIIQGIRLYVSQCDEIKDKAAAVEEMIQGALTFIEQNSLDEAEEVIHGAMTYLDNDDDVKQLSKADHAKGVKYLEQEKAKRGIEKALFVDEVLKGALSYIDKKQVEQAKEIVQAIVMYVAQDDTMKEKAATSMDMMDGALTFLQQDQMDKAKEMIQGAMTYLKDDEDVKEADKLLRGMDVKEQDKLVKDVKEKAEAKAKRVKFLETEL